MSVAIRIANQLIVLITLTLVSAITSATEASCIALSQKIESEHWHRAHLGKVTGSDRMYLYSGPSAECRIKEKFIMPGDEVAIYVDHNGWSQIMFDEESFGWVRSDRLVVLATPSSPSPK